MKQMSKIDQVKYLAKGNKILEDLKKHPEKQVKLEKALRANGFDDIADLAVELRDFM